jgi:CBS domain-containing protein
MKVQEIMTGDVASCHPDTTVADVAKAMWDRDCGTLPVVTTEGRVIGMITDRDICIAVATRGRTADRIAVREVSAGKVYSCLPEDDVNEALETMKLHQVRRLPVVDEEGHLRGILSLNDIVLHSDRRRNEVPPAKVVAALRGISEHRHVEVAAGAA